MRTERSWRRTGGWSPSPGLNSRWSKYKTIFFVCVCVRFCAHVGGGRGLENMHVLPLYNGTGQAFPNSIWSFVWIWISFCGVENGISNFQDEYFRRFSNGRPSGPVWQWMGRGKTSLHRFLTFDIECSQLGWAIKCCALLVSDKSQRCCCKIDQLRDIKGERTDELLIRQLERLRY